MSEFITCSEAVDKLGKTSGPDGICHNGSVTVEFILTEKSRNNFNTANRKYQREEIAELIWKQGILITILTRDWVRVPEIHIRVLNVDGYLSYEMLDGQQRLSAVLHFLTGIIPLPSNMIIDGSDISGLYAKELKQKNIKLYNKIHNYVISCKWYENISDEQASELYVEILNNTNGQYHQEIRNAISGPFADWIRDTARGYKEIGVEAHELFERVIVGKSTKLKLFSQDKKKGFKLLGRMEVDEWLSQLIYMFKHDWRNGVTQGTHTKWVKDMSRPGGDYHPKFKDKKKAENLLKFAYKIINSVPKKYKKQLNPMWAHVLILFAWEKSEHYGKIIPENYTNKFFEIAKDWDCSQKKLWDNQTQYSGNPMSTFSSNFGGRNRNAIGTICKVLEIELDKMGENIEEFGFIEIDQNDFTEKQIYDKWKEQGEKDAKTGRHLEWEDVAGDHIIPRSAGVKEGGITEYHNLQVISRNTNNIKSNMSDEIFTRQVAV
jgi:hypothetical protein